MNTHRVLLGALLPLALLAGCSASAGGGAGTAPGAGAGASGATTASPGTTSAPPSRSATSGAAGAGAATTSTPKKTAAATATKTPAPAGPTAPAAGNQKSVLDRLPGKASNGCVAVGKQTDVRSGSLAVGNFVEARTLVGKGGANGAEVRFYVIPADAGSMSGVRLKATSPKGSVRTVSSKQVEQADQWSYYRVALPVRERGTWRLQFVAGTDAGCFSVAF